MSEPNATWRKAVPQGCDGKDCSIAPVPHPAAKPIRPRPLQSSRCLYPAIIPFTFQLAASFDLFPVTSPYEFWRLPVCKETSLLTGVPFGAIDPISTPVLVPFFGSPICHDLSTPKGTCQLISPPSWYVTQAVLRWLAATTHGYVSLLSRLSLSRRYWSSILPL